MDSLIGLGILLLVAIPVACFVALVLAVGAGSRLKMLEQRFSTIEAANSGALAALAVRISVLENGTAAAPEPPGEVAPFPRSVEPAASAPEPQAEDAPTEPPPSIIGALPSDEPDVPDALPPPPAGPAPPSLEERFGTRWVVWVGGMALALGGIFLVRYSIEQGLLGPAVRIALGAALAVFLIGCGEWLRRQERREEQRSGVAGVSTAHIPSILTAAGTTTAYATVFAAYALYDLVGPAAAFVLLGIIALATLGAALLHGPALAGLGLVGAEVTPLLVSTGEPNYWALYVYLAVTTAAAFALARLRLWRWLAITAVVFGFAWVFPGADAANALEPHLLHVGAGFCLAALLIVAGLYYGPDAAPDRIDLVSSGAIAAYLAAAAVLVVGQNHAAATLVVFAAMTAAGVRGGVA